MLATFEAFKAFTYSLKPGLEKGDDGSTRLYSLADLEPRKSEAIGRRYLAGHYGATPNLSSQEFEAAAKLVGRP